MFSANAFRNRADRHEHLSHHATMRRHLDDEIGYQQLAAYYARESEKQKLGDMARIDDDVLLGRLVDAGFGAGTLAALQLAPLSFVAWADGAVSAAERQTVEMAIHETQWNDQGSAVAALQGWLDTRPSQEIWNLWLDFTNHRLARMPQVFRDAMGAQLLRQATRVALASCDALGTGIVSTDENKVLDEIRGLYFQHWTSRSVATANQAESS